MIPAAIIAVAALAFAAWAIHNVNEERRAARLTAASMQSVHHREIITLLAHHEDQTVKLLEDWRHERVDLQREHRSELREILNRVQHPHLIPTHTSTPVTPTPARSVGEKARSTWNRIGSVAALAPNGTVDDEIGDDIP